MSLHTRALGLIFGGGGGLEVEDSSPALALSRRFAAFYVTSPPPPFNPNVHPSWLCRPGPALCLAPFSFRVACSLLYLPMALLNLIRPMVVRWW